LVFLYNAKALFLSMNIQTPDIMQAVSHHRLASVN